MSWKYPYYWTFLKRCNESQLGVCNNRRINVPPHLRKFRDLYEKYGLGAVKNLWLLNCLLPDSQKSKPVQIEGPRWRTAGKAGSGTVKPLPTLDTFFRGLGRAQRSAKGFAVSKPASAQKTGLQNLGDGWHGLEDWGDCAEQGHGVLGTP